jgi:hypothetical protein
VAVIDAPSAFSCTSIAAAWDVCAFSVKISHCAIRNCTAALHESPAGW